MRSRLYPKNQSIYNNKYRAAELLNYLFSVVTFKVTSILFRVALE